MNTFVFLDMGSYFLGDGVIVAEEGAKKTFHKVGFRNASTDWGL